MFFSCTFIIVCQLYHLAVPFACVVARKTQPHDASAWLELCDLDEVWWFTSNRVVNMACCNSARVGLFEVDETNKKAAVHTRLDECAVFVCIMLHGVTWACSVFEVQSLPYGSVVMCGGNGGKKLKYNINTQRAAIHDHPQVLTSHDYT